MGLEELPDAVGSFGLVSSRRMHAGEDGVREFAGRAGEFPGPLSRTREHAPPSAKRLSDTRRRPAPAHAAAGTVAHTAETTAAHTEQFEPSRGNGA